MTDNEVAAIRNLFIDEPALVVVELGAHTGEDGTFLRSLAPSVKHIMVEPDRRNTAVIQVPGGCRLIQGAIAKESGIRMFHFSDERGLHASGSLLEPSGHLEHFPNVKFDFEWVVNCYTLDEIFTTEPLRRIDLLYVDIQGAESEMILGGRKALERTRYLFMEAEEVEFYKGQVLRPELLDMLPGWKLLDTFTCNVLLKNERFCD